MRASHLTVFGFLVVLALAVSCAPAVPTAAPTKPAAAPAAPAAAPVATAKPGAAPTTAAPAAQPTAAPAANIKRGGDLRMGLMNDWVEISPLGSDATNYFKAHFSDGLTFSRPDAQGLWGPVPALATEWKAEGSSITFKLRKGVKFQDGSDFNAQSVKWIFDWYMTHPRSRVKVTLAAIKPGGVEVIDDYTVRLNLTAPSATLLTYLSDNSGKDFANMYSKEAYDKLGEEKWLQNPVGLGPFQVVENRPGDTLIAKRFDNYWMMGEDGKPLPYVDGVRYRLIVDDSVRLLELKAGNIDLVELMQGKDVPGIKANPDLVYVKAPWVGNQYRMHMSSTTGKFAKDLKLRQAAWYAIDREAIAKTLGQGVGAPLKYHALPGALGYDESLPYYWYDPNKAKQLMAESGNDKGIDITYTVMSRQLDQQQAQMIKQMFDAVGIRTTLDVMERNAAQVKMVQKGDYDFGTSRNPAMPDLGMALVSQMASWGSGNYTHINDPQMDQCIKDGDSVFDAKQRHEIYKKCLTRDYELAYTGYSWAQLWNYVYNKKVHGFKPSWGQNWWIKEIWLDK